jgi:heme/copper-type cytochrome/quinol oxidase subunit 2
VSPSTGEIDLTPGVTADVALAPQTTGTYEMHCSHPSTPCWATGHIVVR